MRKNASRASRPRTDPRGESPQKEIVKPPELLEPVTREEESLLGEIEARRLPRHVAIIMDGNGRWAQRRHLPRIAGHRAGVQSARTVIETCARLRLPALTLYAFSLENWRRPKTEIDFLMRLLREYLRMELPSIQRNNIRLANHRPRGPIRRTACAPRSRRP